MKVTFILSTISAKGGVQSFTGNLGAHLHNLGYKVHYYSLYSNLQEAPQSFNETLVKDALSSSPTKAVGKFISSKWKAKSPKIGGVPLVAFANIGLINKAICDTKPDVVFVNLGHTFIGLLNDIYPKKLFICYYHTPPMILSSLIGRALIPFERSTLKKALPIANSYHVARQLERWIGVRTKVVHPGVHIDKFYPVWGKDDGRTLLYFSRIHPMKRQINLVETLCSILKKRNLRLIIAGDVFTGWQHYLDKLHKRIEQLGLKDWVEVITCIPEERVLEIYSKATICLHAAKEEPFGITVLEAMACGKPVISHNSGGPAEIITSGETGFLVGEDPEEWYQSINLLLDDSLLYSKISKSARLRAECFSWQNVAKQIDYLIRNRMRYKY